MSSRILVTHAIMISILFWPQVVQSQDFYPLAVGNLWRYKVFFQGDSLNGFGDFQILKDTTVDGKQYYYFPSGFSEAGYERIDDSYNIYRLDVFNVDNNATTKEILLDTLAIPIGESWLGYKYGEVTYSVKEDQYVTTWFGRDVDVIQVAYYTYDSASGGPGLFGGRYHYSSNFGIIYAAVEGGASYELRGARINDTTYGVLTAVPRITSEPLQEFSILNPYPNPFNPRTTIRFKIPHSGRTTVRVYDLSGELISTLLDGTLREGTHTLSFEGSQLSSGAYLLSVSHGNNSQTKKILLLR